ncbi:helix-turn-helix domain-containing protein [Parabacteroides sp. Marseille-P3160]|uniref:helix-turn-helix domain-containing protein n=1 Tax=Parabacteroides sp. Marseille-P3160 TaxID=1917887 RepID=UPI0009BBA9B9|nr:helix-turn-helix domain-containing protein [Parabacteroides sp. Marseille-P3160]
MNNDPNKTFQLATDIILNTGQSVFLSGKAGTGKTTFLHHIRHQTTKNIIVAAPTGVAAINADGVTLHSLFQLPFEAYTPDFEGKSKLDYHARLRKSKINMLRELELLVIDEVSMLRADTLDAIDALLRRYRYDQRPFGGVQMLFIGDLFQLPPVVQDAEWERLKAYYPTPFFFHAQALKKYPILHIELTTVFRQNDPVFIDLLNRVRNNEATDADIQRLNQQFQPGFQLPKEERYVLLSTHNYKVDRINQGELAKLPGKEYLFKGVISGDFNEYSLPADTELRLKEGAQVMFTKNDNGEGRRYYNGKLAQVIRLSERRIVVEFEEGNTMEVEPETWKNIRYTLHADTNRIIEEEIGTYRQYPLRLAWAITIHKSQGLTFDRVAIDAGQAFASGQVYVALSRCTSLEGILLFSRIYPQAIRTDEDIVDFSSQNTPPEVLEEVLQKEKPAYCAMRLKMAFNWQPVVRSVDSLTDLIQSKQIPGKEAAIRLSLEMKQAAERQQNIALRFQKELDDFFFSHGLTEEAIAHLRIRIQKAVTYFHKEMQEQLLTPLDTHLMRMKQASRIKQYLKAAGSIRDAIAGFMEKLEKLRFGNILMTEGLTFDKPIVPSAPGPSAPSDTKNPKEAKAKQPKGASTLESLALYREYQSVLRVAAERHLSPVTIEAHLAQAIAAGELSVYDLVPVDRVNAIIPYIEDVQPATPLSPIKQRLGEGYSYLEIKAVLSHLLYEKKKQ